MQESLNISAEVKEGIPLLTINYEPDEVITGNFSKVLASQMLEKYRELEKTTPSKSCIVWIKASTAGSPVVRAIFDLYKAVAAGSGTLVCAGYPPDYLGSLINLGLPVLPGFRLAQSIDDAVRFASPAEQGSK